MVSSAAHGTRSRHEDHKGTKLTQRITTILCGLCFSVIFVTEPGAVQAPQGWPQFRGDAKLTGVTAVDVPATLSLKWTYEAGETIESSAAIVDGVVYVGAGSGDLLAIDLASGKLRWKYTTGNLLGESSPAIGGGLVYVGDLSGIFHAVNVRDGSKAWTFKTGGEIKSSPVITGGMVLIGSYDTHLYALDAKTGKLRWKLKTDGPVHATPSVVSGTIYFGGCDERFRAVRAADGKVLFEVPLDSNTGSSAVIEGTRAYPGTFNNEVVAIDLVAKKIVWRYRDPDREFPYYSSPAFASGRVIVGGRDKAIHAIDAATGKAAWKLVTRARVDSSPAVAGGRVFVGSSDGKLYVLDAQTGAKKWEYVVGDALTASPAIAAGRVVIGAQDGRLYCFG